MSRPALLLRVLLVLALVLNGIGSAVAAVHAHAAPVDDALALALASDAAAPCHEEAPAPVGLEDTGDCCEGARCDCACTAASATVATFALSAPAMPPIALATHRLDAGHRAPALAHPIRPPIG